MTIRAIAPQTAYHKSRPRGSNFRRSHNIHHPGERPELARAAEWILSSDKDDLPRHWVTEDGEVIRLKPVHYRVIVRLWKDSKRRVPPHGSITTMAEKLDISRQTWINVERDLERITLLNVEHRKSRFGNLTNAYVIDCDHALIALLRVGSVSQPKSKSGHNSCGTSLNSVSESVIHESEEQTVRLDPKPETLKAENDPVCDLTGVAVATDAETKATAALAVRMDAWKGTAEKQPRWPLDLQLALAQFMFMLTMARGWSLAHFCAWLAARHSLAKFRNPFAGLRYCARLYARAYTSPAAAPNRLESVSKYSPVAFHDGDPPPRPPRRDDDEADPPAKDLTRADKILGRSSSGVVVPPRVESPPVNTSDTRSWYERCDEAAAILDNEYSISENEIFRWLDRHPHKPKWPPPIDELHKLARQYIAERSRRRKSEIQKAAEPLADVESVMSRSAAHAAKIVKAVGEQPDGQDPGKADAGSPTAAPTQAADHRNEPDSAG